MTSRTVVLAGSLPVEHLNLAAIAAEFGWSLEQADDLGTLANLDKCRNIVTVLFCPRGLDLSWDKALRSIVDATPGAFPILCHGFSETIDWPQAAEAGAFHSLSLPFSPDEVRQSLGFVSSAISRSAIIPIRKGPGTLKTAVRERVVHMHARAAGS
jgi:hypothetical protein